MTESRDEKLIAVLDALTARSARRGLFSSHLFADPAWDILLELYAAALQEQECGLDALAVTRLDARPLLECIDALEGEGLVTPMPETDPARFRLTMSGLDRMHCFFSSPIDTSRC